MTPIVESLVTRLLTPEYDKKELIDFYGVYPCVLNKAETVVILDNVNKCIANAIVRTLLCDMPAKKLVGTLNSLESSKDVRCCTTWKTALSNIPLKYDIDRATMDELVMTLKYQNNTNVVGYPTTGDFKSNKDIVIMNPTFKLCSVEPAGSIVINNIKIKEMSGYKEKNAPSVAFRAYMLPLDCPEEPHPDGGTRYTIPASLADPKKFKIIYILPAVLNESENKKAFIDACTALLERLEAMKAYDYKIVQTPDGKFNTSYNSNSDTDTVCLVLQRALIEKGASANIKGNNSNNNVIFITSADTDIKTLLIKVIDETIHIYNSIIKQVKDMTGSTKK